MCGIVGIVARNQQISLELLESATQSLAHRGPDDSGTQIIRLLERGLEIGLGNRRLAVLDLSPLGHQPMPDPANGNWIVYNGEIYNFREVRQKLEALGLAFTSHSDTEVLLKAYAQWGERCLDYLRGMFAFAIWDAPRCRLFLARDPMGVKPLYYFADEQHFVFASEVRTLLSTGLVPRRLEPVGVVNYLSYGSVCDHITLMEGVKAVGAGHYITWKDGAIAEHRYWDLAEVSVAPTDRASAQAEVTHDLSDAVLSHLVSDVPVGVFLSGGIDSSALVSILSAACVRPSTFSVTFQEAEFNESAYSRAVACQFATDHHEIPLTQQDALGALPNAIAALDQPSMDGVNTYIVAQRARAAGLKVALSGLGADEVFAGYSNFRDVPRMEVWMQRMQSMHKAVRHALPALYAAAAAKSDKNQKRAELMRSNGRIPHPYFLARSLFLPSAQDRLLQPAMAEARNRAAGPWSDVLTRSAALDPINRVSYLEACCYMLNTLLRDADTMSMAHGLELRVPFLDHHFVRRVLALPGNWKLDRRTPKPMLLAALPHPLPDNVVHRPKRGFTLPFEHWLRDAMRPAVEQGLKRIAGGSLASMLNPDAVQMIWADFLHRRTSWSRPWSLFVLQRWCELNL
jgi:asparagine synthase (glutamine-hydrolysing)